MGNKDNPQEDQLRAQMKAEAAAREIEEELKKAEAAAQRAVTAAMKAEAASQKQQSRINFLFIALGILLSIVGVIVIVITDDEIAAFLIVIGVAFSCTGALKEIPASKKEPVEEEMIEEIKPPRSITSPICIPPYRSEGVPLPLTSRSVLAMCWGLTMNLSHEQQQVELGKTFTKVYLTMFEDARKSQIHKDFMQNLLMEINGTVRSIGFIRANHVSYLDYQSDRLTRKRKNLEQIADIGSFSGAGLHSKIGTFIGFGSMADLIKGLSLPLIDVLIFAVAGIVGVIIVTLSLQQWVSHTDESWANEVMKKQTVYWRKHFKPDVTAQLFHFTCQMKALIREYYTNANEIIKRDELLSKTDEEEVKYVISNEILPPDSLKWSPYIIPDAQHSVAGDKAKSQGEDKSGKGIST